MSPDRRFEQELPSRLDDLYLGPMPPYRDHVLQQTARTRQRPAWSFPGRWLPMVEIARQPVLAPRLPWRAIGFTLVLLALLVALVAALVVGGHQDLPKPFGPARNGLVAYASGGDIYTVDPASGRSTAIVKGPQIALDPIWSRDGTHLAFERTAQADSGTGLLYVARADGSDLTLVTPSPLVQINGYEFSPDGKELLITAQSDGIPGIVIAATDGGTVRQLDLGKAVDGAAWRPPDGSEVVFAGRAPGADSAGLYAVDVRTETVRTIVEPSPGVGLDWIRVAPDGSRVAFSSSTADPARNTYQVHVTGLDPASKRDLALPMPRGATFQDAPAWSNDGTRLAIVRGYATHNQDMAIAVVPADGSSVSGVETKRGLTGCCDTKLEWAPDDGSILVTPEDLSGQPQRQLLLDPISGGSRPAPWAATSYPAWQRRAP